MLNIFKKRNEEKERLETEEKQELLALKLKVFSLDWKYDSLKEELEKLKEEKKL